MTVGRASVIDVARRLGVAPSTVSRAFNHPDKLRPETVAAVHRVAEELGYVPNRHARALITGRTGAIGLLVPDIVNPFFPKLVRAAQRSAERHGLSLFVAETNSDLDQERRLIASIAPQTEGVIVASSRLPAEELRHIASRTRMVLVNVDVDPIPRVLISSAAALAEGIGRLHAAGLRHFGYVGGPHRSWSERERRGAMQRATTALGLQTVYLRDESGTYEEARQLTGELTDVQAVIAFDDVIAHGVLDGLQSIGRRVPNDVSLLGCDDALPIQTQPRLSTIELPSAEAIRHATDLLADHPGEVPECRIEVPGVLRWRGTTVG